MQTETTIIASRRRALARPFIKFFKDNAAILIGLLAIALLIQMLSGFCSFEDLHAPQRALISSEARTFLRILFPRRTPYVWPFDRF